MKNKDAYEKGKRSYRLDGDKYQNPYRAGTDEYNSFEVGWTQQLKRSPNVPIKNDDRYREIAATEKKRQVKLERDSEAYYKIRG